MDLLAKGSLWLAEKQERFCSSGIIYVHNGKQLPLSATYGHTEYEIQDEYGVKIGAHVVDFIIRTNAMSFDPTPGDSILVGDINFLTDLDVLPGNTSGPTRPRPDGTRSEPPDPARVYEVMALGSHKCWRWCDAHHHLRRIHTKQI